MMKLYDWQEPLRERITGIFQKGDFVLNCMPTGTGKTLVAVDTSIRLNLPFLVISPKATLINWQRVADSMGAKHLLKGVINPERISLGRSPWYDGTTWHLDGVGLVVWDECHKGCSGIDSKATLAAARLKKMPIKKLFMSATAADSPLKMRALGYSLGLHDYSKAGFYRWAGNNGCFWNKNMPQPVFQFTKSKKDAAEHMSRIHATICDKMVHMKISEIPGFPETLIESKLYDLEKEDLAAVREAYDAMDLRMKDNGTNILTELLHARERSEFAKASLMAELVEDLVEEGRSVVVFLNFRSSMKRLTDLLNDRYNPSLLTCEIHGDQNAVVRQANIDAFQNNEKFVMLAMIQAGGVGISLHDVKNERPRVTLITPGFNAAEMKQALGRVHRAGGSPSTQQFVLCAGTLEERIHETMQRKFGSIEAINEGLTDADLTSLS